MSDDPYEDEEDLQQDIGLPLAGDDEPVLPDGEEVIDDDDYFDRELREVEQELEGTDPPKGTKRIRIDPEEDRSV